MKKVVKINHTRNIFVEVEDEWETLPEGIFKSVIGEYLSAGGLEGYFLKLKDEDGNIPYREDLDDLIVFEVLLDMIECWKAVEKGMKVDEPGRNTGRGETSYNPGQTGAVWGRRTEL